MALKVYNSDVYISSQNAQEANRAGAKDTTQQLYENHNQTLEKQTIKAKI